MKSDYNPNSVWTSKKEEYHLPSKFFQTKKGIGGIFPGDKLGEKKNFIWFFVLCSAFVAGAVFYFFFLRSTQGPNVSISFAKPDQVFVGDPFILSVSLVDNSEIALDNTILAVTLPDGFSFVGQSSDQRVMEQAIGDIGPGSIGKKDFNIIATGDPNAIGHITAKLVYGISTTNKATFESDSVIDIITENAPAIGLNFTIPQNVFSGQDFDTTVTYHNNTSHDVRNVVLKMQYPSTFTFSTSSVVSDSGDGKSWSLGTITAGKGGSIVIKGLASGQANAASPLTGQLTTSFSGTIYTLNSGMANVVIAQSPLSLLITLNNTSTYLSKAADSLDYVFSYANNSDETLQNVTINAALIGAMYDFSTLRGGGVLNSVTNNVTWSQSTNSELASLAPGQTGKVEITLQTKKTFPIKRLSDKNYVLKVQAKIQSPTIPPNTSASSTVSIASMQSKVVGQVAMTAAGYRSDSSGITNSGPFPPKVNKPSQYTIHWNVTNYSTDVRNVVVSAYLQSGTVFTGNVRSNISTQPTYNAATGIVTWEIPSISATAGALGAPLSAVFQVSNTPAINQLGQTVTLISQTNLRADDTFTSSTLTTSANQITTYLPKDATVANQGGMVVQ